jgi:hypothetical protein
VAPEGKVEAGDTLWKTVRKVMMEAKKRQLRAWVRALLEAARVDLPLMEHIRHAATETKLLRRAEWSRLPQDLLDSVVSCLGKREILVVAERVCRAWRRSSVDRGVGWARIDATNRNGEVDEQLTLRESVWHSNKANWSWLASGVAIRQLNWRLRRCAFLRTLCFAHDISRIAALPALHTLELMFEKTPASTLLAPLSKLDVLTHVAIVINTPPYASPLALPFASSLRSLALISHGGSSKLRRFKYDGISRLTRLMILGRWSLVRAPKEEDDDEEGQHLRSCVDLTVAGHYFLDPEDSTARDFLRMASARVVRTLVVYPARLDDMALVSRFTKVESLGLSLSSVVVELDHAVSTVKGISSLTRLVDLDLGHITSDRKMVAACLDVAPRSLRRLKLSATHVASDTHAIVGDLIARRLHPDFVLDLGTDSHYSFEVAREWPLAKLPLLLDELAYYVKIFAGPMLSRLPDDPPEPPAKDSDTDD